MPYNPGIQDRRGEFLAAGIQGGMENLASGLREYGAMKRQDAALTGLIEAFGTKLPALAQQNPSIQKNVEKFLAGKATLTDKMTLAGSLQAAQKIQEEEQQRQARELALAQAKQQQETLARMKALGQFSQGAGTGVLRPEVQAQMRAQLANPVTQFSAQTANAIGQLPSPNDVQQFLAHQGTRPPTMPISAVQQQFPADKFDANMVPTGVPGEVQVKSVSPRAPVSDRVTPVAAGNQVLMVDREGKVVARESVDPAIPAGYERNPQGGVRPITGGPAEIDAKKAELEQAVMREKAKQNALAQGTQISVMLSAIDDILPKVGPTTAGAGAMLSSLPGTPAYNLAAKLDTLKANIGFQQLAQMRAASPTGGALGQVAVQELEYLQAALGNLDKWQSPSQLKDTLNKIRTHVERWQKTVQGIDPDDKKEAVPAAPKLPPGWSIR